VLAPAIQPVYDWLTTNLGWIPLFTPPVSGTGRTILTVGIVLAVMILPIITALTREIFLQTPKLHEEAALALGATRWEMIRVAVLPFGRSGIVSASMLGLGRALGETMAVAMVLSPAAIISFVLTSSQNPSTIASNIALNYPEAHGVGVNVLIATGLILFAITFLVNSIARYVVGRRKEFSGAN
jgi:phosphate transport system permease protein